MAVSQNDGALAIELLDRMIALKPDWSEAYFQRALVFLLLKPAFADVEEVAGSFVVAILLGVLGIALGFALQAVYRRGMRR